MHPQDPRTPLNITALRNRLVARGPLARIEHVETTGSANTDLVAMAKQGAPAWTVLFAEHQSQGRGRMGRRYESPSGAQLTLSLLLRPPASCVQRLGLMPLATGLALVDALPKGAGIQVKWPNDLIIEHRKLCGILAEAVSLGPEPAVVIGLGLNTSLRRDELPVPHATSLELEGIADERNELAAQVMLSLHHRLSQWEDNDPALIQDYREVCATIGTDVRVILPGDKELLGTAINVSDEGLLLVRDDAGEVHELSAGDVFHLRAQHGGYGVEQ